MFVINPVGRNVELRQAPISARLHPLTEYSLCTLVILWRANNRKHSMLLLSVNTEIKRTRKKVPLKANRPVRDRSENRMHEQVSTAIYESRPFPRGFFCKSGDSVIPIPFGQNNNPSQYSCCSGLVVSQ